ncbi:hypothetical protein K9N68_07485 [Kovacikia minuta CCNUW1]|uniref:hypothetical protein n=1 Tax=Kovacikia minuta TaxID=2931930 RepID=UPI001CC92481|nr:hypothetical protein [Kovacikia minuta]UBF27747.1 hypothetical protein K9N68_07485 [Kovacikia minuta CCNUW1]
MSDLNLSDVEFLFDPVYWSWGPCFQVIFFFEKKCPLSVFEDALLADLIVSSFSVEIFSSKDTSRRCVLRAENWTTPLGFIYFQMDRGDHDDYFLSTYPRQVERHCGQLYWRDLENIQPVINLHIGLIAFINRLHTCLGFHHVLIHHEDAPWFERGSLQAPGILIYAWIAKYAGLEIQQTIEPCYALSPFENSTTTEAA